MKERALIQGLLFCYDYLAIILSVISIMIMIILSPVFWKMEVNKATSKKGLKDVLSFVIIVALIIGFAFLCCSIHEKWTVVPNLYGMTYDDALNTLYSNRLKGQLVLASTNRDLSKSDSRVVWQSQASQLIIPTQTKISFVIDDAFSLNSTPLIQYSYRDNPFDQSQKLEYTCDYKDAIRQAVEQEQVYNNGVFPNLEIEDPHWVIEIESAELEYHAYTATWKGRSYTSFSAFSSYRLYAGAMSTTLEEIVVASSVLLGGGAGSPNLKNCTIIGKLIPGNKQNNCVLQMLSFPSFEDTGYLFLPQTLLIGDYTFCFSIIDENGKAYEWYHTVRITK